MNKKLLITAICCVLAAAFILGATGVIDLTRTEAPQPSDRLIGVIITKEYPISAPDFIPGQGIVFGPAKGVLADRDDPFSWDTFPAEYDYSFPGIDGVRLFNVDTPPFEDGHTQINTRAADEEFSHVSQGYSSKESNNNGSKNSTEIIHSITGTLNYALQEDEVTFFSTPIYQAPGGEAYLGQTGGGHLFQKRYMDTFNDTTFSTSSSQTQTLNGITTVEGRTINVNIKLVREPAKMTLCQFNAAHEMIQADEYLPGEMPRDITPLPETVMVLVDTENRVTDEPESHTYEAYSRDNTSFYTLRYKDNGYCPEDYHVLHWPDPERVTDLAWKIEDGTLTVSGHGRMDNYSYDSPAPWSQENYSRLIVEEGITYLGDNAFSYNENLVNICLPESLTEIGSNVFSDDDGLTEVTLPGSVTDLGTYAFSNCSNLRKVTLPDSVEFINTCAFDGCISLEYINLPASARHFGIKVFRDCGNIRSVTVAEGSTAEWQCKQDNLPYDYGEGTPVHVPVTNTSIAWKVENDTLFISGNGDMDDYKLRYRTENPDGPQGAYGVSTPWDNESFSRVVIENGITSIGENTFSNRSSLTSVTLPKSLKKIRKHAVDDCVDLAEINLESVSDLGEGALMGCRSLKSISLSPSLEKIEHKAFMSCSNLTEVRVPDSVTLVSSQAFACCDSLEKINLPASVKEMYYGVFSGCKNLKTIIVEKDSAAEKYCIDNKLPCSYE